MTKNAEIKFIKPCLYQHEEHRELTPEYAMHCFNAGRVVQINLDNCSLQRMEQLPENASISDVGKVGLLPLVQLLQSGQWLSLTAIGVNEMPDWHVKKAMNAYQRFCNRFWPGHIDDYEATFREYNPDAENENVLFKDLPDKARYVYGLHYVSMLQIRNIRLYYANSTPKEKFSIYLHSIIGFLDLVSAYDLEIAKYAFWDIDSNALNQLPESIQCRRRHLKENFLKMVAI